MIGHALAATAHLWIESPLDKQSKGAHGWFNRLFATHPPMETRIAALYEVAGRVLPQSQGLLTSSSTVSAQRSYSRPSYATQLQNSARPATEARFDE